MAEKFYRVYDWMTKDLGLRGGERDVFALIYGFHESRGEFTGSLSYLAERVGMAKSSVAAALRKLVEKGYLLKRGYVKNGVRYCAHQSCRLPEERSAAVPETERETVEKPASPVPETGRGRTGNETAVYRKPEEGIPETGHNNKEYHKKDTKGDNKEREAASRNMIRHRYGEYENVLLTDGELETLRREYPDDWRRRVERLSEYMASTGKTYRNHLATIRAWARQDAPKQEEKNSVNTEWKFGLRL